MSRFFAMLVFSGVAMLADAETLVLSIGNIQQAKGNIVVAIYDKPDHWLDSKTKHAAVRELTYPVVDLADATLTVSDLPQGRFAISVFHDLDSNKQLATNFIGYPKEPFGFSAPMGRFGPPSFEDASIAMGSEMGKETIVRILLH